MEKQIFETDISTIALLYRKKYAWTDMLSYDKICRFNTVVNNNLNDMEANLGISLSSECKSKLYFVMLDERGEECVVINYNCDLEMVWKNYIESLPEEVIVASMMDNALKEIGLIIVNGKIMDRISYYNELKIKYNFLSEYNLMYDLVRPKFDVFRDWEGVSEDSFVEKYCISNTDRLILKELRENKKINEQNEKEKIKVLKKKSK